MTTTRREIGRGESGRLDEQLTGRVWLAQNRPQWPVQLLTSVSQVADWLKMNPEGVVWDYEIKPISQVQMINPKPFLQAVPHVIAAEPTDVHEEKPA
jgi:hypothetical protein